MTCKDCFEWEYFENFGYGCFCRKRTIPLDKAEEDCEDFSSKHTYRRWTDNETDN